MSPLTPFLLLFLAIPIDAETGDSPVATFSGPVAKISVARTGMISFNGEPTTMDRLRDQLRELKWKNGMVWYYREASDQEPPQEAVTVIGLVIENRLPISMSTKPDYSDLVMPDGTVRPRGASRPN